jgi:hypothetical protein
MRRLALGTPPPPKGGLPAPCRRYAVGPEGNFAKSRGRIVISRFLVAFGSSK